MMGAIAGDVVGSAFEHRPTKSKFFPLFSKKSTYTDDTVLTIAVAEALMTDGDYAAALKRYGRRYPRAGYGGAFKRWLFTEDSSPYNSWGNGSAMRVSPVGFAGDTMEDVLREAMFSAAVTHTHPEGIKGAEAAAAAIFLARTGADKPQIKAEIEKRFGYDLSRTLTDIRPTYQFDVSCQGSVPESIIAFLESTDFEDALRNAVSLGGDADTQASIAGAVAHAYYGALPPAIEGEVRARIPTDFLTIAEAFQHRFPLRTA
jgi:ADP-ribosylglycohydrolase